MISHLPTHHRLIILQTTLSTQIILITAPHHHLHLPPKEAFCHTQYRPHPANYQTTEPPLSSSSQMISLLLGDVLLVGWVCWKTTSPVLEFFAPSSFFQLASFAVWLLRTSAAATVGLTSARLDHSYCTFLTL